MKRARITLEIDVLIPEGINIDRVSIGYPDDFPLTLLNNDTNAIVDTQLLSIVPSMAEVKAIRKRNAWRK